MLPGSVLLNSLWTSWSPYNTISEFTCVARSQPCPAERLKLTEVSKSWAVYKPWLPKLLNEVLSDFFSSTRGGFSLSSWDRGRAYWWAFSSTTLKEEYLGLIWIWYTQPVFSAGWGNVSEIITVSLSQREGTRAGSCPSFNSNSSSIKHANEVFTIE